MRVTRVQRSARVINARDDALTKIGLELDKPYGLRGDSMTAATGIEVVGVERQVVAPRIFVIRDRCCFPFGRRGPTRDWTQRAVRTSHCLFGRYP
jgi:hypothetical protein